MLTITEYDRRGFTTGLAYAGLLRRHFPDFYRAHAAALRVSPVSLYGAALAFLSLVHRELIALDLREHPLARPKQPSACLEHIRGHSRSLGSLTDELHRWLSAPVPRVYGLTRDLEQLHPAGRGFWQNGATYAGPRAMNQHGLAIAVWLLLSDGPWGRLAAESLHERARMFHTPLWQVIQTQAVPLTPPTPLARLCARLDREQPHGVKRLGSIVAYLAARTTNPFADRFPDEVNAHGAGEVGLSWHRATAQLRGLGEQQRAARSLWLAYGQLDRRCHQDPALLGRLLASVRQTAGELLREVDVGQSDRGEPYDPRALIHHLEGR